MHNNNVHTSHVVQCLASGHFSRVDVVVVWRSPPSPYKRAAAISAADKLLDGGQTLHDQLTVCSHCGGSRPLLDLSVENRQTVR